AQHRAVACSRKRDSVLVISRNEVLPGAGVAADGMIGPVDEHSAGQIRQRVKPGGIRAKDIPLDHLAAASEKYAGSEISGDDVALARLRSADGGRATY